MSRAHIPTTGTLTQATQEAARRCGVDPAACSGDHPHRSPINGESLGGIAWSDAADVDATINRSREAFRQWRTVPGPQRGAVIKRFGELLRQHKADLGTLVSLEVGKITSEAQGEVQEMIDICDLAVGMSRQLYGSTSVSERPGHRLMETWHPLGVVGVISAFNFPVAVWSWNTAVALVCGDTVVWKPSEQAPLCAWAAASLLAQALAEADAPAAVSQVLVGGPAIGEALVEHPGVELVSATGSTRMGQEVGPRVANRFGRSLLELGGNNAAIVAPSADLDLALRGIVFAAVGTAGQRCTSMRRAIVHTSIADELTGKLAEAYERLPIGNPLQDGTLVGPLVGEAGYTAMQDALEQAQEQGGTVMTGGTRVLQDAADDAYYVRPAIVRMPSQRQIVRTETFAPILYVLTYDDFEEAIALNNDVPQGLSSSLFTRDQAESEIFLSAEGSDCGIANVNIGTSGAEVGGAFGGEKQTGGGRECGSDAWRGYMRRATNTINYSGELPLAQGVDFSV